MTTLYPGQATEAARLPFEPARFRIPLPDDSRLADCGGKRIGILIVTYNALATLLPVLKRITPNVWRNVEEVVVFDDASQDATYELALGVKTLLQLPKLQIVRNPKNLGYGGNQKAGYRHFSEKGFDIVVLLHGDGQYAPEILAHVYAPIVRGEADAVFGSRMMRDYGGPRKGGMPLYKFVGNRILTGLENRALGLNLTEFHSGYRAYNLHALADIDLSRMTDDFHFDTEIIIKLWHQHFRIGEVPIPTYYGREICYVNGMKYARNVLRAVRRYRRTVRGVERSPEFAEYFMPYPLKEMSHSSHWLANKLTGSNHRVLDIGCGKALFSAKLVENGNRVTGIDVMPPCSVGPVFDRYFQADLDAGFSAVRQQLGGEGFDRILLLDVLEHLKDPGRLLAETLPLLRPNGLFIVSLPNFANISIRLMLLCGRFEYGERGILDRTHLRFFTRRSARRLLQEAGLEIVSETCTAMPLEVVLGLKPANPLMLGMNACLVAATKLLPGLFGYQIVFEAKARPMT